MKWIALSVSLALVGVITSVSAYRLGRSDRPGDDRSVSISVGLPTATPTMRSRSQTAAGGSLRIQKLEGSVVNLGKWSGYSLVGVRLRATVCIRGTATAIYPDEFRLTHYEVVRNKRVWWPRRTTIDRPMWLVPFGETWGSKPCGPVHIEDAISPNHYDVRSLGNPFSCYGVGLTIRSGQLQDSKRTIIQCGGIHAQ